jgi:hypothetical protein
MALDARLYRSAQAQLRRWNETESRRRQEETARLSSAELWQRYAEITELCLTLSPTPSVQQRRDKLDSLDRCYDSVRRLEARRSRLMERRLDPLRRL